MIVANTIGKSIRVVEFLPREEEVDHLIIAFDVSPEHVEPVIFGTHGPVAQHYNAPPDNEPHATTLDYVVAAAAG